MEAGDLLWQPLKGAAEREDIFIKLLRGHCYTNWAKCAEAYNSNFSFAKKLKLLLSYSTVCGFIYWLGVMFSGLGLEIFFFFEQVNHLILIDCHPSWSHQ